VKSFEFETLDNGRLTVNRDFTDLMRGNRMTTFDSLMQFEGGEVAKNLLRERITTRFQLTDAEGNEQACYIKRHRRPPWKEYVKPLLRLTKPILGARNEWNALVNFHRAGIATMIPVALGESGENSFLVTKSIEGCSKLSDWMEQHLAHGSNSVPASKQTIINNVAQIARKMHAAGLHHQDFYLTHLLWPDGDTANGDSANGPYIIDLGRVKKQERLSRRWIVKDLAQLDYSASLFSRSDRCRFLKAYLGRSVGKQDRPLLERIRRKSRAIARHSQKNGL